MKKLLSISILLFFILEVTSFASLQTTITNLNSLNITLNKEIVHPNEEVILNIDFGQNLSEFEIDIAYDKNLFEYISVDNEAIINNNGDVLTIIFQTMSSEVLTSNQINLTFKAKNDIVTTNPTDFKVTLESLKDENLVDIANPNSPIEKNLIVEPTYEDYKFDFLYEGTISPNEEKEMKLVLKSGMGRNYSNTKIYASVLNPEGAEVKLVANDEENMEYNFLEEGWGGQTGEPIGGKNVIKEMDLRGTFSKEGTYEIIFKVVDLNSSEYVIATDTFEIEVGDKLENIGKIGSAEVESKNNENNIVKNSTISNIVTEEESKPTELPKAGIMIYYIIIPIAFFVTVIYVCLKKKDEEI
ncbi:MAG: hypothetical protein IJW20_00175 [Clostridia bacterium]|nr:hypothetical protein [Clostridia bacterium]